MEEKKCFMDFSVAFCTYITKFENSITKSVSQSIYHVYVFDAITQGDFQVYVDEFLFRYNFAENNNFCCKSIKKNVCH